MNTLRTALARRVLDAGQDYGWLLALALAFAALTLAWLALNPVEEAADRIGAPIAQSIGLVHERCPGGWQDTSATDDDAHAFVETCFSGNASQPRPGDWLTVLEDGKFYYAFQLETPGAALVCDPRAVPGWPEEPPPTWEPSPCAS